MLRSFEALAAAHPDAVLLMAGPGDAEYLAELRRLAPASAGSIRWLGMLSGDSKWGALHAAEAFVLPSHQENFGIAVVEALACGKPTLISNKVNIWREIADDGAGLVEEDDRAGTSRLLEHWLGLPAGDREAMARRARVSFEQRFQSDRATTHLVESLRGYGVKG